MRTFDVCIGDGGDLSTNRKYPKGYFPVKCLNKKRAVDIAKQAIQDGAIWVRVECPNGQELDFRAKK